MAPGTVGPRKKRGQHAILSKRGATGDSKYDWDSARLAYIEGVPEDVNNPDGPRTWLKLEDIASRFTIHYPTLRNKSSDEKWSEQRESYKAQFAVHRQRVRLSRMVNEAVDFDDKALHVSKLGLAMVTARVSEIARAYREQEQQRSSLIQQMQMGQQVDLNQLSATSAIDADELETLSRAAERWHNIGQKSMGIDSTKLEISGPGGGPITTATQHTLILKEADPERLSKAMALAQSIGLLGDASKALYAASEDDIEDAEVVDEGGNDVD